MKQYYPTEMYMPVPPEVEDTPLVNALNKKPYDPFANIPSKDPRVESVVVSPPPPPPPPKEKKELGWFDKAWNWAFDIERQNKMVKTTSTVKAAAEKANKYKQRVAETFGIPVPSKTYEQASEKFNYDQIKTMDTAGVVNAVTEGWLIADERGEKLYLPNSTIPILEVAPDGQSYQRVEYSKTAISPGKVEGMNVPYSVPMNKKDIDEFNKTYKQNEKNDPGFNSALAFGRGLFNNPLNLTPSAYDYSDPLASGLGRTGQAIGTAVVGAGIAGGVANAANAGNVLTKVITAGGAALPNLKNTYFGYDAEYNTGFGKALSTTLDLAGGYFGLGKTNLPLTTSIPELRKAFGSALLKTEGVPVVLGTASAAMNSFADVRDREQKPQDYQVMLGIGLLSSMFRIKDWKDSKAIAKNYSQLQAGLDELQTAFNEAVKTNPNITPEEVLKNIDMSAIYLQHPDINTKTVYDSYYNAAKLWIDAKKSGLVPASMDYKLSKNKDGEIVFIGVNTYAKNTAKTSAGTISTTSSNALAGVPIEKKGLDLKNIDAKKLKEFDNAVAAIAESPIESDQELFNLLKTHGIIKKKIIPGKTNKKTKTTTPDVEVVDTEFAVPTLIGLVHNFYGKDAKVNNVKDLLDRAKTIFSGEAGLPVYMGTDITNTLANNKLKLLQEQNVTLSDINPDPAIANDIYTMLQRSATLERKALLKSYNNALNEAMPGMTASERADFIKEAVGEMTDFLSPKYKGDYDFHSKFEAKFKEKFGKDPSYGTVKAVGSETSRGIKAPGFVTDEVGVSASRGDYDTEALTLTNNLSNTLFERTGAKVDEIQNIDAKALKLGMAARNGDTEEVERLAADVDGMFDGLIAKYDDDPVAQSIVIGSQKRHRVMVEQQMINAQDNRNGMYEIVQIEQDNHTLKLNEIIEQSTVLPELKQPMIGHVPVVDANSPAGIVNTLTEGEGAPIQVNAIVNTDAVKTTPIIEDTTPAVEIKIDLEDYPLYLRQAIEDNPTMIKLSPEDEQLRSDLIKNNETLDKAIAINNNSIQELEAKYVETLVYSGPESAAAIEAKNAINAVHEQNKALAFELQRNNEAYKAVENRRAAMIFNSDKAYQEKVVETMKEMKKKDVLDGNYKDKLKKGEAAVAAAGKAKTKKETKPKAEGKAGKTAKATDVVSEDTAQAQKEVARSSVALPAAMIVAGFGATEEGDESNPYAIAAAGAILAGTRFGRGGKGWFKAPIWLQSGKIRDVASSGSIIPITTDVATLQGDLNMLPGLSPYQATKTLEYKGYQNGVISFSAVDASRPDVIIQEQVGSGLITQAFLKTDIEGAHYVQKNLDLVVELGKLSRDARTVAHTTKESISRKLSRWQQQAIHPTKELRLEAESYGMSVGEYCDAQKEKILADIDVTLAQAIKDFNYKGDPAEVYQAFDLLKHIQSNDTRVQAGNALHSLGIDVRQDTFDPNAELSKLRNELNMYMEQLQDPDGIMQPALLDQVQITEAKIDALVQWQKRVDTSDAKLYTPKVLGGDTEYNFKTRLIEFTPELDADGNYVMDSKGELIGTIKQDGFKFITFSSTLRRANNKADIVTNELQLTPIGGDYYRGLKCDMDGNVVPGEYTVYSYKPAVEVPQKDSSTYYVDKMFQNLITQVASKEFNSSKNKTDAIYGMINEIRQAIIASSEDGSNPDLAREALDQLNAIDPKGNAIMAVKSLMKIARSLWTGWSLDTDRGFASNIRRADNTYALFNGDVPGTMYSKTFPGADLTTYNERSININTLYAKHSLNMELDRQLLLLTNLGFNPNHPYIQHLRELATANNSTRPKDMRAFGINISAVLNGANFFYTATSLFLTNVPAAIKNVVASYVDAMYTAPSGEKIKMLGRAMVASGKAAKNIVTGATPFKDIGEQLDAHLTQPQALVASYIYGNIERAISHTIYDQFTRSKISAIAGDFAFSLQRLSDRFSREGQALAFSANWMAKNPLDLSRQYTRQELEAYANQASYEALRAVNTINGDFTFFGSSTLVNRITSHPLGRVLLSLTKPGINSLTNRLALMQTVVTSDHKRGRHVAELIGIESIAMLVGGVNMTLLATAYSTFETVGRYSSEEEQGKMMDGINTYYKVAFINRCKEANIAEQDAAQLYDALKGTVQKGLLSEATGKDFSMDQSMQQYAVPFLLSKGIDHATYMMRGETMGDKAGRLFTYFLYNPIAKNIWQSYSMAVNGYYTDRNDVVISRDNYTTGDYLRHLILGETLEVTKQAYNKLHYAYPTEYRAERLKTAEKIINKDYIQFKNTGMYKVDAFKKKVATDPTFQDELDFVLNDFIDKMSDIETSRMFQENKDMAEQYWAENYKTIMEHYTQSYGGEVVVGKNEELVRVKQDFMNDVFSYYAGKELAPSINNRNFKIDGIKVEVEDKVTYTDENGKTQVFTSNEPDAAFQYAKIKLESKIAKESKESNQFKKPKGSGSSKSKPDSRGNTRETFPNQRGNNARSKQQRW